MLMVNESATYGAFTHSPSRVQTWRPPTPSCRSRIVTVPKSVCGPMRNWPGSGGPTCDIGGYQLMFIVYDGWSVCAVKKSGARPSAVAHTTSSSSPRERIRAR
jgi:hypothetical protein